MIVVIFVGVVYFIQFLIGSIFLLAYFKKNSVYLGENITELSVLIPVKNEARRIGPLLERIPSLTIPGHMKVEFIFIDDNSSDGSDNITRTVEIANSKMIQSAGKGKKEAIRLGVNEAQFDSVLTWDADTLPKTNYFVEITKLVEADMWILPVQLGGNKLIQRLGAIEFSWLQILGIGFGKLQSPILCNGANLLFRKSVFERVDVKRTDYDIPSGDDMFLMDAFKKIGADIHASSNLELMVEADSPASFMSLLMQRKRWAGKMNHLKSGFSILFGAVLIVFVFLAIVLTAMTNLGWMVLIPVAIKILNEYLLLTFINRGEKWMSNLPLVLIHQIWYPIYLIRLLFPLKTTDDRWS